MTMIGLSKLLNCKLSSVYRNTRYVLINSKRNIPNSTTKGHETVRKSRKISD